MKCRFCKSELHDVFLDLGSAPPSNAFLTAESLEAPEIYFPLKLFVCGTCRLVQVDEVQSHSALFTADYVYYSSFSRSWLAHAKRYVDDVTNRLALTQNSFVMEIASNDGYLLQYFVERGIPCVGIEPTKGTAEAAPTEGHRNLAELLRPRVRHGFRKATSEGGPDCCETMFLRMCPISTISSLAWVSR